MKKLLLVLLLVLSACVQKEPTIQRKTVDELAALLEGSNADKFASEVSVAYNIFPISYADSDGDGTGDLRGIIDHLDVLNDGDPSTDTDLGITAIWLNPIHPSKTYHKYDVIDYYAIDSEFGTLDDFQDLSDACEERGIKLIIDIVFNHTADDNPWFIKAMSGDEVYRDYYRIEEKLTNAEYPNKTGWSFRNSLAYYASFWDQMPELNADSEAVRDEMKKILSFWMDLGVDGFRYDAAPRMYDANEYPVGTGTMELNKQFWMEMKEYVKSEDPEILLLAEVWMPAAQAAPYAVGFDSMFNFDLATGIVTTVMQGYQTNFVATYLNGKNVFTGRNENYLDSTFLTNHDQNRIMSVLGGNVDQAKLAANILFTLPGIPFIYYGEELGMLGTKPDERIREPYRWTSQNDAPNALWENWELNLNTTPYEQQTTDEDSMFSLYRRLVHFRDASDVLRFGDIQSLTLSNKVLGFTRTFEGKTLTIVHNLDRFAQTVDLDDSGTILYQHGEVQLISNVLTLQPYASVVIGD